MPRQSFAGRTECRNLRLQHIAQPEEERGGWMRGPLPQRIGGSSDLGLHNSGNHRKYRELAHLSQTQCEL